jgi:hypothetical protein
MAQLEHTYDRIAMRYYLLVRRFACPSGTLRTALPGPPGTPRTPLPGPPGTPRTPLPGPPGTLRTALSGPPGRAQAQHHIQPLAASGSLARPKSP